MINKLMQIIAPHHCYGCSKTGTVLCAECKYDIIYDDIAACIVCFNPATHGICENCKTSYARAWLIGERSDTLHDLIDALKFKHVVDVADTLADLLDARLPVLPESTIIVPVPAIASHARQRGYDHAYLIAKRFAYLRGLKVERLIHPMSSGVQRGKSKSERLTQAAATFTVRSDVHKNVPYLLIDDVVTTNATLRFCAAALKESGADKVRAAVVARQPLDK